MSEYNIAILIALSVSIGLNACLFWYNRNITKRLLFISEKFATPPKFIIADCKLIFLINNL